MSIQVIAESNPTHCIRPDDAAQNYLAVSKITYSPSEATDEQLWQAFKAGSKEAYAAIYVHYFRTLFKYGKKITPDEAIIQDCIQDLFIDLLKSRERLGDTTSIKYYLFRSLRRKIAHTLTKRGALQDTADDGWSESAESEHVVSYEQEVIIEQALLEQKTEILKALSQLTKSQQQAIRLRFYDNLNYPEIAAAMSIHVDSVYNLISKSTAFLRKNVRKMYAVLLFLLVA